MVLNHASVQTTPSGLAELTKDIDWLDIGCDGTDTYMIRRTDALITTAGLKIQGRVAPGVMPSGALEHAFAQVLWTAYCSASTGANSKEVYRFPSALVAGENWMPWATDITARVTSLSEKGRLPEEITFSAPNYIFIPANTAETNQTLQKMPEKSPREAGYTAVRLDGPYADGYVLGKYTALTHKEFDGLYWPEKFELVRFGPLKDAKQPGDLAQITKIIGIMKEVSFWTGGEEELMPTLPPDATVIDERFAAPGRNSQVYRTKDGVWLNQAAARRRVLNGE